MTKETKKCNCCGREVDIEKDAYVGRQTTPPNIYYYLELYNCVCMSTYSIKKDKEGIYD